MNFSDYQDQARLTRLETADVAYALLGLSGEVGELHSYFAKGIRDKYHLDRETVKKELGDILWFISAIADDSSLSLQEIAEANIEKLQARQKKGTLTGSGDNR